MNLEEKVKELAEVIKNTPEYQELTASQRRVKLDPKAHALIEQIHVESNRIYQEQMRGNQVTPDMIQKLEMLEMQASNNKTLTKLFEAQEGFAKLMEKVNNILAEEL